MGECTDKLTDKVSYRVGVFIGKEKLYTFPNEFLNIHIDVKKSFLKQQGRQTDKVSNRESAKSLQKIKV